jgi:hypothetical protein
MLTNAGGRIRSEDQWRTLVARAGFTMPSITKSKGISNVLRLKPAP